MSCISMRLTTSADATVNTLAAIGLNQNEDFDDLTCMHLSVSCLPISPSPSFFDGSGIRVRFRAV